MNDKTETQTIDLTPTWRESAGMLLAVLRDGNAEGKKFAHSEVLRMGDIIDSLNAERKKTVASVATLQDCDTRIRIVQAMRDRGGSFVSNLAGAIERADLHNLARIATAFPDLIERYAVQP